IPADVEKMVALVHKLDKPTPQILIEAQIVEATSETARDLGVQWGGLIHNNNVWVYPGANSSGVLGNSLSGGQIDPTSGFASSFLAAVPGGAAFTAGVAVENIGKNILTAQLSALQKDGKLNILSSPSITTIDNKMALIESGDEVPFQTVDAEGKLSIVYKKAVLRLEVTPHVIEGETLKLKIITSKDELDFSRQVAGNPTIITKKAETNVILYDGQTTVIGGLNKETASDSESGIPGLKDIPLLGFLFKGDSESNKMEDILIFITPHILKKRLPPKQPQAAQKAD
ncbi:MAG: type IV pilus secretin PilQ, partial [Desulfobacterales bacterium]